MQDTFFSKDQYSIIYNGKNGATATPLNHRQDSSRRMYRPQGQETMEEPKVSQIMFDRDVDKLACPPSKTLLAVIPHNEIYFESLLRPLTDFIHDRGELRYSSTDILPENQDIGIASHFHDESQTTISFSQ